MYIFMFGGEGYLFFQFAYAILTTSYHRTVRGEIINLLRGEKCLQYTQDIASVTKLEGA